MIFGKIDYINLLPLHVYIKKYPLVNAYKKAMEHKKGVPNKLNRELFYRRIDAAIVSSIESTRKKYKNLDLGICSNKRVLSVLLEKNSLEEEDPSSATSNLLAKILSLKGRVIIGDKALKLYMQNPKAYIDLCSLWYEKTQLPFVFGRFACINKKRKFEKIFKKFDKRQIKIPQYILQKYAQDLAIKDIQFYLNEVIYYKINYKEKKALKYFINCLRFKKKL